MGRSRPGLGPRLRQGPWQVLPKRAEFKRTQAVAWRITRSEEDVAPYPKPLGPSRPPWGGGSQLRDLLFVSHANPEDNDFALWVALRLMREGYPVWCDLTHVRGGEDTWRYIEPVIRDRTVRVLYVLSAVSNGKQGCLNELQLADTVGRQLELQDFIIPLLVDDLRPAGFNIQIQRRHALFCQDWANGLASLLSKLEKSGIARDTRFSPDLVRAWWRSNYDASRGVVDRPETYISNWFAIEQLPPRLRLHTASAEFGTDPIALRDLAYPAVRFREYAVSFAQAADLTSASEDSVRFSEAHALDTEALLAGEAAPTPVSREQARNLVRWLLKVGWRRMARARGMRGYKLASQETCSYFRKGTVEADKLRVSHPERRASWRKVVGFHRQGRGAESEDVEEDLRGRYWHFGITATPTLGPVRAYVVRTHVLFSSDGYELWPQPDRMHRARRGQCKDWWNAHWRDRMLATMSFLSEGQRTLALPMSADSPAVVSSVPVEFWSPVSYQDPQPRSAPSERDPWPGFGMEDL
jgi:hypothetical protein